MSQQQHTWGILFSIKHHTKWTGLLGNWNSPKSVIFLYNAVSPLNIWEGHAIFIFVGSVLKLRQYDGNNMGMEKFKSLCYCMTSSVK